MAKSVVFHIGDPKTGSSSIQQVLYDRSWTSATLKADYPRQLSAFPLANALLDSESAAKRARLMTETAQWVDGSDADVCIISAEQFSRIDPAMLNTALREFMPDHAGSARVVAYVRPHGQRFVAAYMQRMKTGAFFEDMEIFFNRTRKQRAFFYTPRFQAWKTVFGDRFTLRPMLPDQLRDGDVVADFLHLALQGAAFHLPARVRINESLSAEALSGLRVVQMILRLGDVPPDTRHAIGSYMGGALNRAQRPGTRLRLTPELYQKIAQTYRGDAQALDHEFFGAPLLEQALDAAAGETDATVLPMDRAHRLSDPAMARLQDQALALATLLQKDARAWRIRYALDKGQIIDGPEVQARLLPGQNNAAEVQALLDQIAQTITEPPSRAKARKKA